MPLLLGGGSLGAWLLVLFGPTGMDAGVLVFVAAWTVMMAAMMLPSAWPLVLLYRRGATTAATLSFVAGYLIVWAVTGIPAYFAQLLVLPAMTSPHAMPMADPMTMATALPSWLARIAGPLSLFAAGIYQLLPVKQACLARCRSPVDFLMQRWGRGAFRLGIEHGLWCLGCCWALMLVLAVAGSMGLAWVVGIAAIVAIEKLARRGVFWSRATGAAFLLAALYQGVMSWRGS